MKTMINTSSELGQWLSEELVVVSKIISTQLHSPHDGVNEMCDELAAYRGKMLRPSLLLLAWRSASKNPQQLPDSVRSLAAVVELIHLATLVHDDVLDEAAIRRGETTIHKLRGNEAAVMLGDYLLSSAFHLCSTAKNPSLNLLLGEVASTVCSGETMQLYHRNNIDLSTDDYYQIIGDKTASLIAASCAIGGMLGGGLSDSVAALTTFGESVGVAFQIRDDVIDLLGEPSVTGKASGVDMEKGKLTLPIISMLENNPELRPRVLEVFEGADLSTLCSLLKTTGSIQFAKNEIVRLVDLAVESLLKEHASGAAKELCLLAEQLKD